MFYCLRKENFKSMVLMIKKFKKKEWDFIIVFVGKKFLFGMMIFFGVNMLVIFEYRNEISFVMF